MLKPVHIFDADLSEIREELTKLMAEGSSDPKPRSWIQVAKLGRFEGHPMGPFEFTSEIFDTMISNFFRKSNKSVPVDFEHATEMPAYAGNIPSQGAPATGWIVDLKNRGEAGLWGLVEWLEPGLSYVRAGRYKFFSPAVVFDYTDGVSGENLGPVLTSGALTNRPFLDGMAALAASRNSAELIRQSDKKDTTTMTLDDFLKMLALALGEDKLSAEAAIDRVTTLRTEHTQLDEKVKTFLASEKKREQEAAIAEVDTLIKEGVFQASQRENILSARTKTPDTFRVLVASMTAAKSRNKAVSEDAPVKLDEKVEETLTTRQVGTKGGVQNTKAGLVLSEQVNYSDLVADKAEELAEKDPAKFMTDHGRPNKAALVLADKLVAKALRDGELVTSN